MKNFSNLRETVDISEEQQTLYWTRRLKVSEASLKSAIRATCDVNVQTIEAYLKQKNAFAGPSN
ncbi:DUF3606 domain-containing protein [Pedobacter sp. SYP-B3415]|uniref:DUF3606 domain-containing protein n=1 Tax=Pedobacter sp. SYP-B3415 TaxID=2496641 RepID=UPI00101D2083|nr:DUF3606 domain-containing protein [Pedobacter sp. SYP-B3415]